MQVTSGKIPIGHKNFHSENNLPQNNLPREVWDSPVLDIFKTQQHMVLRYLA